MKRRTLLASAGSMAAVAVAGCVDRSSAGGGDRTTDGTTRSPTSTAPDGAAPRFDPDGEPVAEVPVGDREGVLLPDQRRPHGVVVWNDADAARTLGVRLVRGGSTVLDRTWEVPADRSVAFELLTPGAYALHVTVGGETASVGVGARFDCNQSTSNVRVAPDGSLDRTVVTTLIACQSPGIEGHDFTVEGSSCGSRDGATVTFDAHAVRVSGRVTAPTPCHGAELAGAAWDAGSGTLTLTVATTDRAVEGCVQCIGEVAYRATVAFEERPPERVVIEHEHRGTTEVVTRATRE